MEQYIDKSALVAEIENRIKELQNLYKEDEEKLDFIQKTAILICMNECKVILSLLDTLEVKEVELELNSFDATVCKICNTYLKEMDKDAIVKALEPYKDGDKVKVIIKAQKGEEV